MITLSACARGIYKYLDNNIHIILQFHTSPWSYVSFPFLFLPCVADQTQENLKKLNSFIIPPIYNFVCTSDRDHILIHGPLDPSRAINCGIPI